jgi:hypothetical protein
MARYSAFFGRRVEVQYRAGDILLHALGAFVADSGRSIFLEQHFEQHGQQKNFRWEIPYQYIIRIEEKPEASAPPAGESAPQAAPAAQQETPQSVSTASAAHASGGASPLLPLPNDPKPA